MNNPKNVVLYGLAGGTIGYGIAHFAKLTGKGHWTLALIGAGAIIGGIIGNNAA